MFAVAVAVLILTAAFIAIARKGIPFESEARSGGGFTLKLLFVVCIGLLGMFQSRVIQKRGR